MAMVDWIRRIDSIINLAIVKPTALVLCASLLSINSASANESSGVEQQWALASSQTPLLQLLTAEKLYDLSASPESLLLKGVALTRLSRLDEAESLFLKLADEQPGWSEPLNNLGVIYSSQGKWQQAIDVLQKAVASNSGTAKAYSNIKEVFDYRAAIAYQKALDSKQQVAQPELELHIRQPRKPGDIGVRLGQETAKNGASIRKQINYWLAAWENGQVNEYLSVYAISFEPEDGKSFEEWKRVRRARLQRSNNIQISYESLGVYLNESQDRAVAQFKQHYTSNYYRDTVLKELVFTRHNGRWLIESEVTLKSYENS